MRPSRDVEGRARRAAFCGAALAVPLALFGACSTKSNLVDRGGECFLATDCAPGLVCVEQRNGARQCTDDLTGVAGDPPGQGGEDMDGAAADGPAPPTDGGGGQDTGTVVDTGVDTGPPPQDAGAETG